MEQSQPTFSISELAKEFNVTPRTIRFYEDRGLLSPRRDGHKRIFTRRDRARLKLALRGKRLGFSLAEIAYLIGIYATDRDEKTQLTSFLSGLQQRKAALLQQREDIEAVLHEVCVFEEQCRQLLQAETEAQVLAGETLSRMSKSTS